MSQRAQAGVNALGGYIVGRMEGRNNSGGGQGGGGGVGGEVVGGRIPSKRALSRYLEYQKGAYGAHLDYLGGYSRIAQSHAEAESQLNEQAAAANHSRQRDLNDQANQHEIATAAQEHVHATQRNAADNLHALEEARLHASLSRSQMRAAAKIAPGLQTAGVQGFEHTADGVKLNFFEPKPAKSPKSAKKPKDNNGMPADGGGKPVEPVEIPDNFTGMSPEKLAEFEAHKPRMTPAQKRAHTRAKNAQNPAKPEGLNETIHPDA